MVSSYTSLVQRGGGGEVLKCFKLQGRGGVSWGRGLVGGSRSIIFTIKKK